MFSKLFTQKSGFGDRQKVYVSEIRIFGQKSIFFNGTPFFVCALRAHAWIIKVSQKMVADRVLMAVSLKASRKKVAVGVSVGIG